MNKATDVKENSSTTYSPWSDVAKITDMSITFMENANAIEAEIFGNGLNQVGIMVNCVAVDSNQIPISISPSDIFNNFQLCDWSTGQVISTNPSGAEWVYSGQEGQFCTAIYSDGASEEEKKTTTNVADAPTIWSSGSYYLYWNSTAPPQGTKTIAACANIDGTLYSTSNNGNYRQSPAPVVSVLPQIVYSLSDLTGTWEYTDNDNWACTNYYWSLNKSTSGADMVIAHVDADVPMSSNSVLCTYYNGNTCHVNPNYSGVCLYTANHHVTTGFEKDYYMNCAVLWQIGGAATADAPGFAYHNSQENFGDFPVLYPTAINQYPNQMCVTKNDSKNGGSSPCSSNEIWINSGQKNNITIYDQYGNAGLFNFTVVDWENPQLNGGHV